MQNVSGEDGGGRDWFKMISWIVGAFWDGSWPTILTNRTAEDRPSPLQIFTKKIFLLFFKPTTNNDHNCTKKYTEKTLKLPQWETHPMLGAGLVVP